MCLPTNRRVSGLLYLGTNRRITIKITDPKILAALQNGKRIRQPNFTSNDEFFLSSNGVTITSSGRIFVTGKENAPIPMQIDLLASDDWEIVNNDGTKGGDNE